MKTFHVKNYEKGSWGYYRDIDLVVIAESQNSAISLARETYSDRPSGGWTAEELEPGVTYITSSES